MEGDRVERDYPYKTNNCYLCFIVLHVKRCKSIFIKIRSYIKISECWQKKLRKVGEPHLKNSVFAFVFFCMHKDITPYSSRSDHKRRFSHLNYKSREETPTYKKFNLYFIVVHACTSIFIKNGSQTNIFKAFICVKALVL